MSLAVPEPAGVYLAAQCAAVHVPGRPVQWIDGDGGEAPVEEAFAVVRQSSATWSVAGRRAEVWLSGALAPAFVCPPLAGLGRWSEVQAYARVKADELTAAGPDCNVSLDDWPLARPVAAVAASQPLLNRIRASARQHGVRLTRIVPWWNVALRGSGDSGFVCVDDTDAMTVIAGAEDAITATTYHPRPVDFEQVLSRLALTHPGEPPLVIRMDRDAPSGAAASARTAA